MFDGRYMVPPSPPTSPHLFDMSGKDADCQDQLMPSSYGLDGTSYRSDYRGQPTRHEDGGALPHDLQNHASRYRNSSYFQCGPRGPVQQDSLSKVNTGSHIGYDYPFPQQVQSSGPKTLHSATSASSLPHSSSDRLTPRSPETSAQGPADDEEMIDSGGEDEDDGLDKANMTPAEIRAQKRKMKRHRLTHTQTRFLVSEFARQAHPDAAHRDRLAREIPGLSSRQVQVWFQNRRAKLKRSSHEDRDRIMRSRALPPDFDNTRALRAQYGASSSSLNASLSSSERLSTFAEQPSARSLALETTRRMPEYDNYGQIYPSPTGVSPALGSFNFTPPASEQISPDSAPNMSPYLGQQHNLGESTARYAIGMPPTSHAYPAQESMYRLPYQEKPGANPGDAIHQTLRTSISHSGLYTSSNSLTPVPERASSFSETTPQSIQRPYAPKFLSNGTPTEQQPYGLTYPYYPQSDAPHQQPSHVSTVPDSARHMSNPTTTYDSWPTTNYTSSPYGSYAPPQQATITTSPAYQLQTPTTSAIESTQTGHVNTHDYLSLSSERPHLFANDVVSGFNTLPRPYLTDSGLPRSY